MQIQEKDETAAIDYRDYFFFKILYMVKGGEEGVSMVRAALVISTLGAMAFSCFISATQSQEMERLLDNLKGFLLELMVFMVAINECVSRRRMNRLVKYIEKCKAKPRYDLPEEETIMKEASKKALFDLKFYAILFSANFPLMMITKPVTEALAGHSWKQLPFPWTILPSNGNLVFVVFLIFQTLGIIFSHCLGVVGMCFSTITTQITALFDVLILGIDRIEDRAAKKMKLENLTYQQSMLVCIKESMDHHRELIQEMLSEKPHLESTFFAEIVNISMIMACEAYPLIKDNVTFSIAIKGIVFLVVQVLCTAVLCDRMEIMANQNTEVFRSLYDSPWYRCDAKYRTIIVNGLTFSQHPLSIKGKSFLGLKATRATFYTAMVNTFNMLSMIRKMG